MSKVDTEYCDCCGGILYHSMSSLQLPRKSFRRWWWWHGHSEPSDSDDICSYCFNAISEVLEARRAKADEVKSKSYGKSPSELMAERKPLTPRQVKQILRAKL
jgi:hypothetical protein